MNIGEKTAILVDGGFYKRQARRLFGTKTPQERALELVSYCRRHLQQDNKTKNSLYRIFYYDCEPLSGNVYHPFLKKDINFNKTGDYAWNSAFYEELSHQRKVALRMGELALGESKYILKPSVINKLFKGLLTFDDIKEDDFILDIKQKGVDMRIGLDIASLAYKKQVSQIVLIAGDSDFVPAAKHARREGIDFILDPMHQKIKESLSIHIDGLKSRTFPPNKSVEDPLHVDYKSQNQKQPQKNN